MPKIRKLDIPFGQTHLETELHYNAKQNFFIKGLPADFEAQTGFINTAPTEAALVSDVCQKAKILADASTVEDFFISAVFTVGSSVSRRHDFFNMPEDYRNLIPSMFTGSSFSRPPGFGFSLSHEIVCRVKVLDNVQFYHAQIKYNSTEVIRTSNKIYNRTPPLLIPYTADRLRFFEQMEKAVGRMAFQIADFFAENADNLGAVLDTMAPMQLLANNEQESERPE